MDEDSVSLSDPHVGIGQDKKAKEGNFMKQWSEELEKSVVREMQDRKHFEFLKYFGIHKLPGEHGT